MILTIYLLQKRSTVNIDRNILAKLRLKVSKEIPENRILKNDIKWHSLSIQIQKWCSAKNGDMDLSFYMILVVALKHAPGLSNQGNNTQIFAKSST